MGLFSKVAGKDVPKMNQTEYLINGEIRNWDGPVSEVLSPICIETSEGPPREH
jgi:glyceraldehyde-3-phosphate dehydrogenase (NADP+)